MKTTEDFIKHWDMIRAEQGYTADNVIAIHQQMQIELLCDIRELLLKIVGLEIVPPHK